jgi:hypothetical protein
MFEGSSSRNQNSKYSINGLSCIYQFKPNPKGKRFDLFFQYEMTYQRFSSQGTHPGVLGTVIPYNGKEWFLVNFIGYGLSIHFLRNFELKHNIGLGYLVNQRTYNGKSADSNLYPISGNTRLSLSYTFR